MLAERDLVLLAAVAGLHRLKVGKALDDQAVALAEREDKVDTDAARTDVVVRVRGRVIPIRTTGTGLSRVAPVAPKDDGAISRIALCVPRELSKPRESAPLPLSALVLFRPDGESSRELFHPRETATKTAAWQDPRRLRTAC